MMSAFPKSKLSGLFWLIGLVVVLILCSVLIHPFGPVKRELTRALDGRYFDRRAETRHHWPILPKLPLGENAMAVVQLYRAGFLDDRERCVSRAKYRHKDAIQLAVRRDRMCGVIGRGRSGDQANR